MRSRPVDERDRGFAVLAELVAKLGGEFQPARAAANDHNAVQA